MTALPSKGNPLALIIEDHNNLADLCWLTLERAGFVVELVQDGQAALDRLATITPALILLDLHLPHISGQQVLDYIRVTEHLSLTRVILTTADTSRAKALQNQADFFLEKPFSFFALYDLAKSLCSSNPAIEAG
jgi:DNA-binding response OmpR family regulator